MWFGSSDFIFGVKNDGSNDGDSVLRGSVVTSHFSVKLTDGSIQSNISVLFVHVMNSGSWLILYDNAESFNMSDSSFVDFVNWQNLSGSALGLEKSSQMVPEFRFSDDVVSGEQSKSIDFRGWVLFSG